MTCKCQDVVTSVRDGEIRKSNAVQERLRFGFLLLAGMLVATVSCHPKKGQEDSQSDYELDLPQIGATLSVDLGDGVRLEMVYIAPGAFTMGCPCTEEGRQKSAVAHEVKLTTGCWLGKYEVTQAQWKQVMHTDPTDFKGDDLPVDRVSWDDCQEFIRKLNAKLAGQRGTFRLPTEAEWEYACRAGGKGRFCFGDDDAELGRYAWYGMNSGGKPHPVGRLQANAWGFYDMHGNVCEHCADWSGDYPTGPVTDPLGPSTGSDRIFRGGCWGSPAQNCRAGTRGGLRHQQREDALGFRIARNAFPAE